MQQRFCWKRRERHVYRGFFFTSRDLDAHKPDFFINFFLTNWSSPAPAVAVHA